MATTKITKGASFRNAAEYDLTNGRKSKAELEYIENLPATDAESIVEGFKQGERARLLATNLSGNKHSEFAKEFECVSSQKPGIKEPVHKVSISLKPGEHLETHQWLSVGQSYLKEMGYADSPYLIAQHREKNHEHIHILTSRVDFNGKVVSDSFERKRARQWTMSIEEKYRLSRTPAKATEAGLNRVEIEQAIKTKEPPPKMVLQSMIKQSLIENNQAADFVESLEKRKVSVMVKTNQKKEIIGISFGYAGKKFKGSKLGTNNSWHGLQENGLSYEPQRDYERLEAASRRASEPEQSKFTQSKRWQIGQNDYVVGNRFGKSSGYGGDERRRDQVERVEPERVRSGIKTEFDEPSAQSVSAASAKSESVSQKGDGKLETGGEGQLRRSGESDREETQTFGRFEQTDEQTASTGETETSSEIFNQTEQLSESAIKFDEERFYDELAVRTETTLYDQSSASNLLSTIQTGISQPIDISGNRLFDGTGYAGNDGSNGNSVQSDLLDWTDPDSTVSSGMVDAQGNSFSLNSISRASDSALRDFHIFEHSTNNLCRSDERASAGSVSWKIDLSVGLREKLNKVEETADKTRKLQDNLDRVETERQEAEILEEEISEVRTSILKM